MLFRSFAAPSADKGTSENADNNTFGEHNSTEVEYVHRVTGSIMQPYVINSHEQGSLDLMHHISFEGSQDQDLKQVGEEQNSSTADHSIFEGHSEQGTNKAEQ